MNLPSIIEEGAPISRTISIHPVFLLGVSVSLLSTGAMIAEVVLSRISGGSDITTVTIALMWFTIGVITFLIGIVLSRQGGEE